jgi:hypothetical protein
MKLSNLGKLILPCLLVSSLCFSYEELFEITENNHTDQMQLQFSLNQIFIGPAYQKLCDLFNSPADLTYSSGLNSSDAELFFVRCGKHQFTTELSKKNKKRYFLFSQTSTVMKKYDSWTDTENTTYLNENLFKNTDHLTNALLHELAITHDLKMSSKGISSKYGVNFFDSNQKYFDLATQRPIAYSFAAVRAFNFEQNKTSQNHRECKSNFLAIFNSMPKNTIYFFESDQAELKNLNRSKIYLQKNANEVLTDLNTLLNDRLILDKKSGMTFCQFMSEPELDGSMLNTLLSSGPKPWVVGGWNTDMKRFDQSQNTVNPKRKYSIVKPIDLSEKTVVYRLNEKGEIVTGTVDEKTEPEPKAEFIFEKTDK